MLKIENKEPKPAKKNDFSSRSTLDYFHQKTSEGKKGKKKNNLSQTNLRQKTKNKRRKLYLGFYATAYLEVTAYNKQKQSDPKTEQKNEKSKI